MSQSLTNEQKRARKILRKLKKVVPDAGMILRYSNNWELLVAVILSAQCTDKQVNKVTKELFKKYKTLSDYVNVSQGAFEKDIYATGFYRNKAKNIRAAAKMIQEEYGGNVPKTMEKMIRLPGVSRKTANVVLGKAYGVVEGIAVDTHVKRLAQLLELSRHNTPEKIEKDLMGLFPKREWFRLTYYLIEYGRKYCTARTKDHSACPLAEYEIKGPKKP